MCVMQVCRVYQTYNDNVIVNNTKGKMNDDIDNINRL